MARATSSEPARRRLWSRPVVQFLAAGLLALALLLVGVSWLSRRAATNEAVDDARTRTELLARTVIEPGIPRGFVDGEAAALDRFDRLIRRRILSEDVARLKVWDATGTILYSDETRAIGQQFELDDDDRWILSQGGSEAEVSDLSEPENRYERDFGELLEVYTRVVDPDGTPLLLEAYYPADRIAARTSDVMSAFRPISVAGLALFLLLTVPIVWVLARRLDAAAAGRERLLLAAASASDVERRRIARDLHDGVVQDLAGVSFELSATARELDGQPEVAAVLDDLGGGVAIEVVCSTRPDVVLMDLQMPVLDGVEATARITELVPDTQVVILTSFSDRDRIVAALDAGAIGYLLKDAEPDDLLDGVRSAARGESPLHPRAARQLLASRRDRPPDTGTDLTRREVEVLGLVRNGLANKQIARRLGISERTVKAHLTSIFVRIGVSDRTQAALWAERNDID